VGINKNLLNNRSLALRFLGFLFLVSQILIFIGDNGTFEGQGEKWWNMYKEKTLKYTRPSLVEFMNSKDILISNVVLQNSPFWNIHPVYCR
jgi:polygalacturonase